MHIQEVAYLIRCVCHGSLRRGLTSPQRRSLAFNLKHTVIYHGAYEEFDSGKWG